MFPDKIFYEPSALDYELGRFLKEKYHDREWMPIENHNKIEEFQKSENSEFTKLKQYMIVGTRKTHKYVPNHKTSDYLVPYTSSGCSAMCLYCYLVCNYNKCSYLRLFVNREEMMNKLIRTSWKSEKELTFEIGSNSDLILENTFTENLVWTIEKFAQNGRGYLTFPTKFDMIENLLSLDHKGKIIFRMSVNPSEIIKNVEFGTSRLDDRIKAANAMHEAGYKTGLLIAPVILIEDWKKHYTGLFDELEEKLSDKLKQEMFLEIIFMTYSYVHRMINKDAFPNAIELYDREKMTGRGMGKYTYQKSEREDGEEFLRMEISKRFPHAEIKYIV